MHQHCTTKALRSLTLCLTAKVEMRFNVQVSKTIDNTCDSETVGNWGLMQRFKFTFYSLHRFFCLFASVEFQELSTFIKPRKSLDGGLLPNIRAQLCLSHSAVSNLWQWSQVFFSILPLIHCHIFHPFLPVVDIPSMENVKSLAAKFTAE